jgi:porphobilinogen synthase
MRVALTGPDGDRGSLGEGLRAQGLETVSVPLLEQTAAADEGALRAALARGFDLLAFSSRRGVEATVRAGGDSVRGKPCLAVGPETAAAARSAGFLVVAEGKGTGAAGLLSAVALDVRAVSRKRILLPASDRARPDLADGLRGLGATVEVVAAYGVRTAPDPADRVRSLRDAGPDAVVLASPSAAEALAAGAAGAALPPLVALGTTTAAAMEGLGLRPAGVAARPTAGELGRVLKEIPAARGAFPAARPRRLRRTEALRRMVRETRLTPDCLVAPMFVVPGEGVRVPVASMPGVFRVSADEAVKDAGGLAGLGVPAVILFGIPAAKDAEGSGAWDDTGPVCTALRALRAALPGIVLWADVCLCEYTDHGHCGLLDGHGCVRNDETLPLLARAAVAYARAGADAVCPSAMMDGQVRAIRGALDREGLEETLVVSYAVKYASAFYGPFRDAAGSTPRQGDRKAYQMDPANAREALREAALDEAEGADVLMVKPALAYLDVIRSVRARTSLPVAAYNVSGEYAMVKAAAERGWIDGERVILETLTAIRRAGADLVVTYHAAEAARLLARGRTA